jgi:hypothetical protein
MGALLSGRPVAYSLRLNVTAESVMSSQNQDAKIARKQHAKRAAAKAGKQWSNLSKEERLLYLRGAQPAADENKRAALKLAKKEAKQEQLDWATLSKDERKRLIKKFK